MNVSKSKINLYKFVSTTGIAAAKGADKTEKATVSLQEKNVEAINQLGSVVNGISSSILKIEAIEIARAKALAKKKDTFKPEYTKVKKLKGTFADKFFQTFQSGNFLKGLFQILGALFKLAVLRPLLKWLANENNKEMIVNAFKTIATIFKHIFKFVGGNFAAGINNLADALKGEGKSNIERIFLFAKSMVHFGAILLAFRWLNPLRIGRTLKDIKTIFTGFHTALHNFRNGLRAKRGLKPLAYKGMASTGKLKWVKRGGKYGLMIGGAFVLASALLGSGDDEKEPTADPNSVVDADSYMKELGDNINLEYKEDGLERTGYTLTADDLKKLPQMAQGGALKPRSPINGIIRGPDTGYPVSLDGGKTASFIGHGTERIVNNHVVPLNNAATRANPYLTDFQSIAAGIMPEMFLGGIFKGAGNLLSGRTWSGAQRMGTQANTGTGRDGGFGAGTHGSGWPSAWDGKPVGGQTNSPSKKPGLWGQIGNFLTKGDGTTSGAQMIGSIFGNEQAGASIGNILGIFQGGGSGEGGKATGWDIIKGIGGVAGSFMKGSKAGEWINSAMGIGEILKGEGNWQSKFRDIAGSFGDKLAGLIGGKTGSTIGNFLGAYFNGTAGNNPIGNVINAITGGSGAVAGTGKIADLANQPGFNPNIKVRDPDGGPGAATRLGKAMLNRGYTVFNNPYFRNNKFKKESGANEGGFDPSGRQPTGSGPLTSKGLGLDITDYRPGDPHARLRNLADFLRGQIDTYKIVQIIYDKWGMWMAGDKEKRGPSRYGLPNRVHVGVAEKTPDDETGTSISAQQAVATNTREVMKNALEQGDGTLGGTAMSMRKIFNQASFIDNGGDQSILGNDSIMDFLNPKKAKSIFDISLSDSQFSLGTKAFEKAQDDSFLTNYLQKHGADDAQATQYMSSIDAFADVPKFDSYGISFADSVKAGNSMFTTGEKDGQTNKMLAKSESGIFSEEIKASMDAAKMNDKRRRGSGVGFVNRKDEPNTSTARRVSSPVNKMNGIVPSTQQDKRKEYYQKKAATEREQAVSAMQDKIAQTIQAALAQVEAHNTAVGQMVKTENQKVDAMRVAAGKMLQRTRSKRQQNRHGSHLRT